MQDMALLFNQVHALLERTRGGQEDPFEQAGSVVAACMQHHNVPIRTRPTLAHDLLLSMMSLPDSEDNGCEDPTDPRPWSMARIRPRLDQPVAAGCAITMRQAAYAGMWLKHMSGMTDKGLRIFAGLMSKGGFVPKPNSVPRCAHLYVGELLCEHSRRSRCWLVTVYPFCIAQHGADGLCPSVCTSNLLYTYVAGRSEYLMRKILDLRNAEDFGFEMCANYKCPGVFGPHVPRHLRQSVQGQRCPLCGAPRFTKKNGQICPSRRCFHLNTRKHNCH